MPKTLENLLVSCIAIDGRPSRLTNDYIERLRSEGATILSGEGATDVSLARCLQAESVLHYLSEDTKAKYVLWLDADVATSIECTQALVNICAAANRFRVCSVSGAYVNRHRFNQIEQELAAYVLRADSKYRESDLKIDVEYGQVILRPALTGLGCLLQPRAVFENHCRESAVFSYGPLGRMVHEVCNSRVISHEALRQFFAVPDACTTNFWHGEDFDYTAREFKQGRPVYFAPIDFGHESRTILLPNVNTILPGWYEEKSNES